jgi:hypothetical protein
MCVDLVRVFADEAGEAHVAGIDLPLAEELDVMALKVVKIAPEWRWCLPSWSPG